MQLRKVPMVPVMLSMLTTIALLFGGWFLYQKVNVEEPIRTQIGELTSVELTDLKIEKELVDVKLKVTKPELVPDDYMKLMNKIEQTAPDKKVNITFEQQDDQLKKLWSDSLYSFTEAVDWHRYSKIPTILDEMKTTHKLDQVQSHMDEDRIYVYMKRGKNEYFAIVPKAPKVKDEVEVTARG